MPLWFKVDDRLPDNRKTRRATEKSLAPMGLWVLAGAWSGGELTDGFVPKAVVRRWDPRLQFAKALVAADLWEAAEHDGEEGYRFINWAEYQPLKKLVEADRAAARERMQKRRATRKDTDMGSKNTTDVRANVRPNIGGTNGAHSGVVRQPRPDPTRPDRVSAHDERESPDSSEPSIEQFGPAIPINGWALVRDTIPDQHPQAVRTDLAMRAGALLKAGQPAPDVRAALELWLTKPHLGPAALPALVSEAIKARAAPVRAPGPRKLSEREKRFLDAELLKDNPNPEILRRAGIQPPPQPKALGGSE